MVGGCFDVLTFETMCSVVAGEEGLTSAITQVAVTINDADLAVPISVALVVESYARRGGRG